MREVYLQIDHSLKALIGRRYGRSTFDNQIAKFLEPGQDLKIIFPGSILLVTKSFLTGFTQGIIDQIGYADFTNHIQFASPSTRLTAQIYKDLG